MPVDGQRIGDRDVQQAISRHINLTSCYSDNRKIVRSKPYSVAYDQTGHDISDRLVVPGSQWPPRNQRKPSACVLRIVEPGYRHSETAAVELELPAVLQESPYIPDTRNAFDP